MFNKKPLLYAGISGILAVILPLIFSLFGAFLFEEFFSILGNLLSCVFSVAFIYGFYYLGVKYKNKLLIIASMASIVFTIVVYFVFMFGVGFVESSLLELNQTITEQQFALNNLYVINASVSEIGVAEKEIENTIFEFVVPYLIPIIVILLCALIIFILSNIALIKFKKIKYAKITGIIGLVSMVLFLTIFGVFFAIPLIIAYYVMLVVILFNEAKNFKEYR